MSTSEIPGEPKYDYFVPASSVLDAAVEDPELHKDAYLVGIDKEGFLLKVVKKDDKISDPMKVAASTSERERFDEATKDSK